MNKELIRKIEKKLAAIKNSRSDYQVFLENFKSMVKGDEELEDWINENYK